MPNIERYVGMVNLLPAAATPSRLYTVPSPNVVGARAWTVDSKLVICNQAAAAGVFLVWIGLPSQNNTQAITRVVYSVPNNINAYQTIYLPGRTAMPAGSWIDVQSSNGAMSFFLHFEELQETS